MTTAEQQCVVMQCQHNRQHASMQGGPNMPAVGQWRGHMWLLHDPACLLAANYQQQYLTEGPAVHECMSGTSQHTNKKHGDALQQLTSPLLLLAAYVRAPPTKPALLVMIC